MDTAYDPFSSPTRAIRDDGSMMKHASGLAVGNVDNTGYVQHESTRFGLERTSRFDELPTWFLCSHWFGRIGLSKCCNSKQYSVPYME
ncbi:hypothetical protein ACFX2I_002286 [Malus domestica]